MKTNDLIRALAADPQPSAMPLRQTLVGTVAAGLAVAFALLWWVIRVRPDFMAMTSEPRFILKFVVTLALAVTAGGLMWRLVRPGAQRGPWVLALLVAPTLLVVGIGAELMMVAPSQWAARAIGRNSMFCLRTIPLLSAPILISLLIALRASAPMRPMLAGATAGLLAGGLGAALYAAHCTDDSPLFIFIWYSIGIAIVSVAGALIGARLLRW